LQLMQSFYFNKSNFLPAIKNLYHQYYFYILKKNNFHIPLTTKLITK